MRTVDLLIEPRWVIPVVPKGIVLTDHAVVVDAGRILDVLPAEEARSKYEARKHDVLKQSVVMPGFVNLHTHAAMNLVRGLGADLPLMDWLTTKIWPAEGKLMSDEFVEEGSFLAGLELAASGVTTANDSYFFPEAAARGLNRAGLRAAVSAIVIGFPSAWAKDDAEYLEKGEALLKRYAGSETVKITVGPHAPYTVSDEAFKRCAELSDAYDAPIHIHVNETAGEVADSIKLHGVRPIERLRRLGLLNERLIAVHSVHADAGDIAAMAAAGASMCHCPCSNLKLASGFAPVAAFMKAGVNVGIGTDGAASNDKLDMLGETRLAAMLAKVVAGDTTTATVADMLYAATMGGAKALGWERLIGSVEIGKAADLIAVDLSGVGTLPIQDPAAQLLYAADRENIVRTWANGELIASRDKTTGKTVWHKAEIRPEEIQALAEKWQNRI